MALERSFEVPDLEAHGKTCLDDLEQGLGNFSLQVKSSSTSVLANKVLLKYSHMNLFTYCLWLHLD